VIEAAINFDEENGGPSRGEKGEKGENFPTILLIHFP